MAKGGPRVGAGRRPKPIVDHLRRNTFRPDRHGERPTNVLEMPAAPPGWEPTPADRTLGPAGVTLLDRVLAEYDVSTVEGLQLLEAAKAADVLAQLRGAKEPDLRQVRLWSTYFTGLLRALGLSHAS